MLNATARPSAARRSTSYLRGVPLVAVLAATLASAGWARAGGIVPVKVTAADGAAGDAFGTSIASCDTTLLVGAYQHVVQSVRGAGAAYVFAQSGAKWALQAELAPSDPSLNAGFGGAVALDGAIAVVGASGKTVGTHVHQGAAYVFAAKGSTWVQQAMLALPDGAAEDAFGQAVAVSGGVVVVGAPGRAGYKGAAFVYAATAGVWSLKATLTASDGGPKDNFGASVAIDGQSAVVGAPAKSNGALSSEGAAYAFLSTGSSWAQQAKLLPSDGAKDDGFGGKVALGPSPEGETIIAGSADKAPGAAYVFTQSGATWPQVAKLTAPGTDPGDNFGSAVAQRGGTAVIGARSKQDEGTAYLFTKAGTWKLVTELQVPARAEHDEVGSSVALGILPAGVLATVGSLQGGKGAVHVFLAPH